MGIYLLLLSDILKLFDVMQRGVASINICYYLQKSYELFSYIRFIWRTNDFYVIRIPLLCSSNILPDVKYRSHIIHYINMLVESYAKYEN